MNVLWRKMSCQSGHACHARLTPCGTQKSQKIASVTQRNKMTIRVNETSNHVKNQTNDRIHIDGMICISRNYFNVFNRLTHAMQATLQSNPATYGVIYSLRELNGIRRKKIIGFRFDKESCCIIEHTHTRTTEGYFIEHN